MRRSRVVREGRDASSYTAMEYLVDSFGKFLNNAWVHMERRVAKLQGMMFVILAILSAVLSMVIYLVVRELGL